MTIAARAAAVIVLTGATVLTGTTAAQAAGETLNISVSAKTGTPAFDATDGGGFDSGEDNNVIRTNDYANYHVDVVANGGTAENPIVTLTLPRGQEFKEVPPWCDDANGVDAVPTPAMPAPAVPLTATSWEQLPQQTITCHLADMPNSSTQFLEFPAWQRSEVPNGTQLDAAVATIKSDFAPTPVSATHADPMVVSAGPKWDLSKNGMGVNYGNGYSYSAYQACGFDPSQTCQRRVFSVLISGPDGGKGLTPLTGSVSFLEDLSPASFYGDAVVNSAAWQNAGADAVNKYAPRLVACGVPAAFYMSPGNGTDMTTSVRKTGTISCPKPELGEPAQITISGTDWSLYTAPTSIPNPAGTAVPGDKAYAVSANITVDIPVAAVRDLGTTVGSTTTLAIRNEYTDFTATGLDGTPQSTDADDLRNNYVNGTPNISVPGSFTKYFAGVPGQAGNTIPSAFMPGFSHTEGMPGSTYVRSGETPVGPGQTVISMLQLQGANLSNAQPGSALLCDAWDNTRLQLKEGDYPAGTAMGQRMASNGEAVWLSNAYSSAVPDYTVQYSGDATTSGAGAGSTCNSGTWHNDPADVAGNDPELAAQGIFTAVHHVRILTTIEQPNANAANFVYHFFSVALRVVPGQEEGAIQPNWASSVMHWGEEWTMDQMLGIRNNGSTYIPDSHLGSLGDRLIYTPSYVRVAKQVSVNGAAYADLGSATAGDDLTWRIRPVLSTAAPSQDLPTQPVYIEECLPAGVIFDSASVTPQIAQQAPAPAGAELACDAGTYLRFNLGEYAPSATIPDLILNTRLSQVALPGTYTNTVVAQTDPADPTSVSYRTDTAQIRVGQIAGVKLEKQPLTPVVQVNPAGNTNLQPNLWRFDFVNMDSPDAISNVDVIDVLPVKTGTNGSDFSGTMTFGSVEITAGTGVQVWYTSAATVSSNPTDATNGATGIAWCDAPAGGTLMSGVGECPTAAADVTGLRLTRPGPFVSGELITALVTMYAEGNADGDEYVNAVEGRADGLEFHVGPVLASEVAVDASIGDFVWVDANRNGVQDAGEAPVASFPVSLSGTDDLGNAVTLTTTTDEDGRYSFAGLRAGTYVATFDPAALKENWAFTAQNSGDDDLDSDGDVTTGVTEPIALAQGVDRTDIDQGVTFLPASLGDFVWIDLNRDGVQSEGELPVADVRVVLTGTDEFGNEVTLETATDENGLYLFENLAPGTYTVTFDPATLPAGYDFVAPGAGDDRALDSDGDPVTGETAPVTLAAGENNRTIDQGVQVQLASLGDYVWEDADRDGVQDDDEKPVAGVRVTLTGTDIYGNEVTLETVTDDKGLYLFENLVPGTYVVTFDPTTIPAGYNFVAPGAGDDTAADSDGDPVTGATAPITLAAGENNRTIDQGIQVQLAELGDYVWFDTDRDGVQDEGEEGVSGFRVVLTGTDIYGNEVTLETVTDENGRYMFTDLVPGDYVVMFDPESLGSGRAFVAPGAGTDTGLDSDGDVKTGKTVVISLGAGESNGTIDQGIVEIPPSPTPTPTPPVTPTPTPTDPGTPTPTPTDPGTPEPTDPGTPTPTDPGQPTPTDPGQPTPTDPAQPTPTMPGEAPALPSTGADAPLMSIAAGLIALAIGAGLVLIARRRVQH